VCDEHITSNEARRRDVLDEIASWSEIHPHADLHEPNGQSSIAAGRSPSSKWQSPPVAKKPKSRAGCLLFQRHTIVDGSSVPLSACAQERAADSPGVGCTPIP
jgi:hypothetical protein